MVQQIGFSMNPDIFGEDYKTEPYWWRRTPRPVPSNEALPKAADVVIIGSGYTGLCAALVTARAGLHTVVLDAEDIGWGCSARNGGQVSTGIGVPYGELVKRYGEATGYGIAREGHNALAWIEEFTNEEQIECDFRRSGLFYGAHTQRSFEKLAKSCAQEKPEGLDNGSYVVQRCEQSQEIDSDFYHGGVVYPRHACVDPARFHQGILNRVIEAGAEVVGKCAALKVDKTATGYEVNTSRGPILARDVFVATNGYTGDATPWMRNRIVPIGSYMLATEPLGADVIERLLPSDRMIVDTREMVVYYRTCPERRRIVFGGRVSASEPDAHSMAPVLHHEMVRIFPELASTRIVNMWMGFVGFSFDFLPHLGRHDGIYYSMGYCGSGISMSGYLGTRIGQQIAGLPEGDSPLMRARFEGRFYYHGKPWFMGPALQYYKLRDRFN